MEKHDTSYVEELTRLASDSNSNQEPTGLLAALYALRGDKQKSKAVLLPQVTNALQILSDDIPDNDPVGFTILYQTLAN